jgi:hypothetical protein
MEMFSSLERLVYWCISANSRVHYLVKDHDCWVLKVFELQSAVGTADGFTNCGCRPDLSAVPQTELRSFLHLPQ